MNRRKVQDNFVYSLILRKCCSMTDLSLVEKINSLPPEYLREVEDFVDFIREKKLPALAEKKERVSGQLKGKVWMSEDFDAPLDDFKDYM